MSKAPVIGRFLLQLRINANGIGVLDFAERVKIQLLRIERVIGV
jgi:hypothetical protein